MSINILGGVAKGFKLSTPNNLIRPTSVLLKRRYFDSKQDLSGFEFVDLCAGSGAMGLEALSRGADRVFLNENHPKVFKVLKDNANNIKKLFETDKVLLSKSLFHLFLNDYELKPETILFFDPPYDKIELYKKFADFMQANSKGTYIVEFCRQKTMSEEEMKKLFGEPERSYQQGTSFLYIYDFE
jgi:16S rRNA (guanine966-N2)-methyltransferase